MSPTYFIDDWKEPHGLVVESISGTCVKDGKSTRGCRPGASANLKRDDRHAHHGYRRGK